MKKKLLTMLFCVALIVLLVPAALATDAHNHKGWNTISNSGELENLFANGGKGYLTNDIMLNACTLQVESGKEITLCLNGHVLNGGNSSTIVNKGTLTLIGCNSKKTVHYWIRDVFSHQWIHWNRQSANNKEKNYFTTNGGCITGMTAPDCGHGKLGGAIMNRGILDIDGVDLVGNVAEMGGAIYSGWLGSKAKLTLKNSDVLGNVADIAGAIVNKDEMEIYNTRIAYNTAKEVAGVFSNSNLLLGDGTIICNNTTNDSNNDYPSAGVYSYRGKLTVKGKVIVKGNTTLGKAANMVICRDVRLNCADLAKDSVIGISKLDENDIPILGAFAENAKRSVEKLFFADDNATKAVKFNDNASDDPTDDYLELVTASKEYVSPIRPIPPSPIPPSPKSPHSIEVAHIENGTVNRSVTSAKVNAEVHFTVTPESGYEVAKVYVTNRYSDVILLKNLGNGEYSFKMPDVAVTIYAEFAPIDAPIEDEPIIEPEPVFDDVTKGDYFAGAVDWAVEKDITNGLSATAFGPNKACTRAEAVTFLWRMAGCPEVELSDKFTDVEAGSYYEMAVSWAIENGITLGTSETTFSPDMICNRGHIVTFLYRYADGVTESTKNPFSDVKADEYYENPVLWAVEKEITTGKTATRFAPEDDCTRGQIVTFMWRLAAK